MSQPDPSAQLRRENPDPHESKNPIPPLYLVFFGGVTAFAFTYLVEHAGKDFAFSGDERSVQVQAKPSNLTGSEIFESKCAACHQKTGVGVPRAFPPLVSSPWLLDDKETPIRIVLLGLEGKIEVGGQSFDGSMPHFADQLTDAEIARVLTHERSSWGNQADAVTEADVTRVRGSLGAKSNPWSAEELVTARSKPVP